MYKLVHCDFNTVGFNPRYYWGIAQEGLKDGMIVVLVGDTEEEPRALARIHEMCDRKVPNRKWFEAEVIDVLKEGY